MQKEKKEKDGWRFSSISSGAHLKRWLDEYEEMGFDVYLEQIDLSKENKDEVECGSCTTCYWNEAEPPYRIYIKSRES